MSLTLGTRLGPYEVLAPIDAGRMSEMWKACDVKLGREAALKILPLAFASDSVEKRSFREELLASLDHPNIAVIHGLEESDGVSTRVLALVNRPTLAERIAAGPISNWFRSLIKSPKPLNVFERIC